MTKNKLGAVLVAAALLVLAGCGTTGSPFDTSTATSNDPGAAAPGGVYSGYGVVQSIELVQQQNTSTGIGGTGTGIGIGAIAGAVVGGVLGNQVGGGSGQTIATVAGAAGGAYVGNEIEKGQRPKTADSYKIRVHMDSGAYQTVAQGSRADLRVGDRVRISNGTVGRY